MKLIVVKILSETSEGQEEIYQFSGKVNEDTDLQEMADDFENLFIALYEEENHEPLSNDHKPS
jgi:hypothetical protein